jgi:hypothetical protein
MDPEFCLNCGAKLEGPWCHACGQPVKGMIRHLKSILHDFLDTVFEYDSRIWRTLVPLYFVPGQITLDYVAGKRIRFVLPFRLFFVLTVVAFLILQFAVTPTVPSERLAAEFPGLLESTTVEDVSRARDQALEGIDETLVEIGHGPLRDRASAGLERARRSIERDAQARIDWIEAVEVARAEGRELPPEPRSGPVIQFGADAEPWDLEVNPLEIPLLPEFANAKVNEWIGRAVRNIERVEEEPGRYMDAFLGLLPAVLFVLMPIFALLLKVFYVFTGRLYMEHMVAALHSHSFLALALIVSVGSSALSIAVPSGMRIFMGYLYSASLLWIPVYLLIMQRRVYGQSWGFTLIKFVAIGSIYLVLVTAAVSVAVVVTLVRG